MLIKLPSGRIIKIDDVSSCDERNADGRNSVGVLLAGQFVTLTGDDATALYGYLDNLALRIDKHGDSLDRDYQPVRAR